ncbi:MAG: hypothetical protein WC673_01045 [Candidatus Paceibacterota bacterium]
MTVHHVASHKVRLMLAAGAGQDDFEYRFQLVRDNINAALKQIQKIREVAMRENIQEILSLLDEETIEAGHDR